MQARARLERVRVSERARERIAPRRSSSCLKQLHHQQLHVLSSLPPPFPFSFALSLSLSLSLSLTLSLSFSSPFFPSFPPPIHHSLSRSVFSYQLLLQRNTAAAAAAALPTPQQHHLVSVIEAPIDLVLMGRRR